MSSGRAPLGARFVLLWFAAACANLGDGIRVAAFPLLAAALTGDPLVVAAIGAAEFVPWVVFGPVAGTVVDRFPRLRVMLWVNVGRLLLIAGVVAIVLTGTMNLWVLAAVAMVYGVGETLYDTANSTVVPSIVASDQLERANGRLTVAEVGSNEFVGPMAGAALFGLAIWAPFTAHGFALAASILLVSLLVRRFTPRYPRTEQAASAEACGAGGVLADAGKPRLRAAVRFLLRDRVLCTVTAATALIAAVDTAWFAVLVLYTLDVLGATPGTYGVLLAVGGVGGILGAVLVPRLSSRIGPTGVLIGAMVLCGLSQLTLGLTSTVWVAAAALAVSSAAFAIWNVQGVSVRQRRSPSSMLGRLTSLHRSTLAAMSVLGALLGGVVAQAISLRATFLLSVPVLAVAAVVTWRLLAGENLRAPGLA